MTSSALSEPIEAFPIPEGAVVLEHWSDGTSLRALAITALRQAMTERLLALPLGPELDLEAPDRLLALNRFALQLVCGGLAADQLAIPTAPWREATAAPQLLLAALVDGENGVVHFPGVLTGEEWIQAARGTATKEPQSLDSPDALPLDVAQFRGGIERLFTLVQLLEPAALPRLALTPSGNPALAALARGAAQVRDWLQGQIDPALDALGGVLQPATAASALRSSSVVEAADLALAVLAIPLGISPEQQLVSGAAAARCIERFQLLLIPTGSGRIEGLLLRLVGEIAGDLLPAGLSLTATQGSTSQSISAADSSRLDLRFPASEALISVTLHYPGSAALELPPLQLPR